MTNIGVNLSSAVYWSTENAFIDHFHLAGKWLAKDSSGADISSTLTFNSRGDVTNLQAVSSLSVPVGVDPITAAVSHEYVLTYDGTAKVAISGAKIVSQTAGKVVFDYTSTNGNNYVSVTFTGLNASNPVGDVHVVRADQVNLYNSGEIFNPAFIDKVSQWSVVRFMDWGDTNASESVSWASRTTMDDASWSLQTTLGGVPIEAMVKLANEAHVDMWYNVPTKADDAYVTQALTYIRDHLDPTLKVHVEWSNEVWNAGFDVNKYAQTQANALWGNGTAVKNGANVYYGYRSAQIASIAHKVFGVEAAARLSDVLAGQAANSGLLTYILQGVNKAGLGTASSLFHDYAIAPYFGGEMGTGVKTADLQTVLGWAKAGASGVDAAFHELQYGGTLTGKGSLATIHGWLTSSATVAKAAGLSLVAYEGGISFASTKWAAADKPAILDFYNRLLADPRMGDLYSKLVADFTAVGGTDFIAFNDVGGTSDYGSWGLLNSTYDKSSPRYDALRAVNPKVAALLASTTSTTTTATHASSALAQSLSGHIVGTSGNDHLVASSSNDTVEGNDGNDSITGSSSSTDADGHMIESDFYMGGAGSDTVIGGEGNDHVYGNAMSVVAGTADGADSLMAGNGNDYVQGNAGADTIDGGDGNDRLYGGADNDSVLGGNGNDYLQGNKGDDVLAGDSGDDTVHGGGDNDHVYGGTGNDQLFGDAGNDTLVGGDGIDTLAGSIGSDMFVFSDSDANFATSGSAAYRTDEITDFVHGTDTIMIDFTPTQLLQGAASSAANAAVLASQLLQAHAGESDVAAVTVGGDTYLFWDADGTGGAPDSAVKVDHLNANSFSVADFI